MKILLSAYACEPNRGSEAGIGWHWSMELARQGHSVWTLTRANYRPQIEDYFARHSQPETLHFLYYDLPAWMSFWKRGDRGVYAYYYLWQIGAYNLARKAHRQHDFDIAHHVTFGVFRLPSFMGELGIPFLFGPVGGGETAPQQLTATYSLKGKIIDRIREIANKVFVFDPFLRRCFSKAKIIYTKTPETRKVIPKKYRSKVFNSIETGVKKTKITNRKNYGDQLKLLFAGRFLYWKGMGLGFRALAHALERTEGISLTMVGRGPEQERWEKLVQNLDLDNHVTWKGWIEQEQLFDLYEKYDVFYFPSLHDSSGNVVIESLSHGLPVVSLDTGGPAEIIDNSCGRLIPVHDRNVDDVIEDLAAVLTRLQKSPELIERLSRGAIDRSREFSWENVVGRVYNSELEEIVD